MSELSIQEPSGVVIFSHRIPASLQAVSTLCGSLATKMQQAFGGSSGDDIDLGLVEAMSNIVRHGYQFDDSQYIEVTGRAVADGWEICIQDYGTSIPDSELVCINGEAIAFDPDDIDNLPEGGMGIGLIFGAFDAVYYHAGSPNTMRLQKHFPRAG